MVQQYSSVFYRIPLVLLFLGLQAAMSHGQNCFTLNPAKSNVQLEPGPATMLPANNDTVFVSCKKAIVNFQFSLDFIPGVEPYFENFAQLNATLSYKSLTFILKYDKASNVFSIPDNQLNFRAGEYKLNVNAMSCSPPSGSCANCTLDYTFFLAYKAEDVLVDITPDPNPAVLTCYSGSTVTLKATPPPTNAFDVQWSLLVNNQFMDIPGAKSATLVTDQSGTYQIIQTGPGGCVGSTIFAVNPPQMPELTIDPDIQVLKACEQKIEGVSVKYFGTAGNLEYAWTSNNTGILISGADTDQPTVGAPGVYSLIITRVDNGCTDSAVVTTVPGDIPVVTAQIQRDPATGHLDCNLHEIKLLATGSQTPGSSQFKFNWSDGLSNPELKVTEPGIYAVTVTSTTTGCRGATSLLITQDITIPVVQIQSARDTICAAESITLTALTQEPTTYLWSNNTTNQSNIVAPLLNGPTAYAITVTANDNGCTNTAVKWIVQVDAPVVTCLQDDVVLQNGDLAALNCTTTGNQISWVTNAINVRNIPASGFGAINNQVFQLENNQAPGSVEYSFYGINSGCTSKRVDVQVSVLPKSDEGIFVPELVTPNGDGLNDRWDITLPETTANPAAYKILLFNRYGAQVYEGTLANTVPMEQLPDGSYYYAISTPAGSKIRGAVTVLRRQ